MKYEEPIRIVLAVAIVCSFVLSVAALHKANQPAPMVHMTGASPFEGQYLPYGSSPGSIVYATDAGRWATLDAGDAGYTLYTGGSTGVIPYWGPASSFSLPDAGAGGIWAENDAGVIVAIPASTSGNYVLYSPGNTGGLPFWGALTSAGLGIPGTVSAPPTIAGGGWTSVYNATNVTTATDQANSTILFTTSGSSTNAGNAFVRAGSNTNTMSIEIGCVATTKAHISNGNGNILWCGAEMYEVSSTDYLAIYVEDTNAPQSGGTNTFAAPAIYMVGTHFSAVQSFGTHSIHSQPFVRLIFSGTNVLGEVSEDKQFWEPIHDFSVAITTAFSGGPDGGTNPFDVGAAFSAIAAADVQHITLFDFVSL